MPAGGVEFDVCLECYTHRGDIGVTELVHREVLNSTLVLCFTCIEVTLG